MKTKHYSNKKQFLISALLIIVTSVICFFLVDFIGYRAVALILLLIVSLTAILFDIYPVLFSAFTSALVWNFFFIPPIFTFHVGTPEDALMFLMYFVIALINAVLMYKIKQFEHNERVQEEREKTIKLYNTILNSLSHELKTPISTIVGAIDTIKNRETKLSEYNKEELYSEIETAVFRLNKQVENLLSMSRLEAGVIKLNLDWIDFNELIFTIIKRCDHDKDKYSIVFIPDEKLPMLKIDRVLMEQIVGNILNNALQHTPVNTVIEISVSIDGSDCVITISDNGMGFPPDEIGLVFDKFYRLNNSAAGGTGLGLSICKGYVEALGGNIFLSNNKKGGATFIVAIPVEISSLNLTCDE